MAIREALHVLFAPYGVDSAGRAYGPHETQAKVRQWARQARQGQPGHLPCLYVQHGVNAGGTRGALTPALEYAFEQPGLRVLIGRKDYTDLRASGMETVLSMVDPKLILEANTQEHRYRVMAAQGNSQIFFRELKDIRSLGSQEFAVIVVLEAAEITLSAYRTLKQRCRQGTLPSFLILEGNPPTEGHWLSRVQCPTDPEYDPDLTVLKMPSQENWAFMTDAYRRSLLTMPELWRRRMVEAEIGGLPSGTPVYPSFIESLHVRSTSLIPDRPIVRGWDFGLRFPAVLFAQVDDARRLYVQREWLPVELPEEELIQGVVARTNEWYGPRTARDCGDPAAENRDPSGHSTLMRLARSGIRLEFRRTTYQDRIPFVNQLLSEMVEGLSRITIDPACRTLIEALGGGYHYPELIEGQPITRLRQEPVREPRWCDVANAFEYLCINTFMGMPPMQVREHQERRQARREQLGRRHGVVSF